MKKLLACFLVLSAGYVSAAEFSGNVTLATDYRFRGISQGDRSPAIQGGFDLETESGLYVGTWASNVGFAGSGALELDVYGGFAGDFSESVGYDVGVLYYAYPESDSDPDFNYVEIYGSLSFGDATLGVNYSPDYYAETDSFWYLYAGYSMGLGENFSLDLHVGLNKFDDDAEGLAFGLGEGLDGEDQYVDYSVGISTSAAGLDFSLAWVGTDLDEEECFGDTKLCDDSVVFSVSKSL
ncbi:MAG: TorF family putative porin [Pseudomonadales bacterium]|nr:TorF family putative porin [Pseudomonadales bacterium]MDP6469890.1 TorF family putative porin [Pseudomonadales bacterium]MDP6827507.1 TorF family putative porin [Pseudomonadales bacterium]MDP6971360.1 TorF family putative porin [Pseudomonadales bacterium]